MAPAELAPGAPAAPDAGGVDRIGVDWVGVAVFYAVALAVSVPLMLWRDLAPASWAASGLPTWLRPLLTGWGPALGALVASAVRGRPSAITLVGTSARRSAAVVAGAVAVVAAALAVPAMGGERGGLVVALGFGVGLHALAYAAGEEIGWRGYLHGALAPLARRRGGALRRAAVLGPMWAIWHATTFLDGASPAEAVLRMAVLAAVLTAASLAIGAAVDRTHSVAVATVCHLWYTVPVLLGGGALDARIRAGVLALLVLGTVWAVHRWPLDGRGASEAG